jgi:uncharacterized membrane protein YidH (DUF202 family)
MRPIDEGMPQERTFLSWRRTILALSIAGFALARLALSESLTLAEFVAAMTMLVIVFIIVISMRLYRGSMTAVGVSTFIVSATTFLLGLIEILLILKS